MARHLAVFDPETVKLIFSGKKKIEGRFSRIKIPPFGKVSTGDTVYVKVSGEKIVGQFVVDRVFFFDHPSDEELAHIKTKYKSELRVSEIFWKNRENIKFVSLMFIRSVSKFIIPPYIPKKDLRPWVVLE